MEFLRSRETFIVNPDMLPTATSVRTVVSDKSMEIDTPDAVVSRMEVASGCPPAGVDISGGLDALQTAVSVTTEKWLMIDSPDVVASGMEMAGGSPPGEFDISVGPDVLLTAISMTTVVSEKSGWRGSLWT